MCCVVGGVGNVIFDLVMTLTTPALCLHTLKWLGTILTNLAVGLQSAPLLGDPPSSDTSVTTALPAMTHGAWVDPTHMASLAEDVPTLADQCAAEDSASCAPMPAHIQICGSTVLLWIKSGTSGCAIQKLQRELNALKIAVQLVSVWNALHNRKKNTKTFRLFVTAFVLFHHVYLYDGLVFVCTWIVNKVLFINYICVLDVRHNFQLLSLGISY